MSRQEPRFDQPDAAETAFYTAFAAIDPTAMEAVWVTRATPICVHPGGGLHRGRQAVMQSWLEIFSGSDPPTVQYRLIGRLESGDLAVHLVEELIRPHARAPGPASRVLATNVYIREQGSWRMVEHHASLPLRDRGSTANNDRQLH